MRFGITEAASLAGRGPAYSQTKRPQDGALSPSPGAHPTDLAIFQRKVCSYPHPSVPEEEGGLPRSPSVSVWGSPCQCSWKDRAPLCQAAGRRSRLLCRAAYHPPSHLSGMADSCDRCK